MDISMDISMDIHIHGNPVIDALDILCAQLTRDLFAIAKFLLSVYAFIL